MTSRPSSIMLAPGHEITSSGICKKRAVLDTLPMRRALDRIRIETRRGAPNPPPDVDFFGSIPIYEQYKKAMSRKDWIASDSLFFTALASDSGAYRRLLEAEEWSWAFNGWLRRMASTMPFAYRWIDPGELESLKSGTFRNRAEKGPAQRNHKAFSLNPDLRFLARKVMITAPLTTGMRDSLWCVRYTALPRVIMEKDETIRDPKNIKHSGEAEIRVPDGTAIPHGTTISVEGGTRIDKSVLAGLEKWCAITS